MYLIVFDPFCSFCVVVSKKGVKISEKQTTTRLLCSSCSVVPERTKGVEDFVTREVEGVGDYDLTTPQRGGFGSWADRPLQAGPGRLQDRQGNGALAQVHLLWDGVDDDVSLRTSSQHCTEQSIYQSISLLWLWYPLLHDQINQYNFGLSWLSDEDTKHLHQTANRKCAHSLVLDVSLQENDLQTLCCALLHPLLPTANHISSPNDYLFCIILLLFTQRGLWVLRVHTLQVWRILWDFLLLLDLDLHYWTHDHLHPADTHWEDKKIINVIIILYHIISNRSSKFANCSVH